MRALPLSLLLFGTVLSGCLGESPKDPADPPLGFDEDWSELALAFGDDHDHKDPLHHANLTTRNFQVLGRDTLVSPYYGKSAGGYLCGDAGETVDGRRLAVVESRSDVGFAVADVTDPLAPKWLGELVMKGTYVYDVAVVPDGRHVVLVTSNAQTGLPLPVIDGTPEIGWRSACAPDRIVPLRSVAEEDPVPRPLSMVLVDISDASTPTIVDQRPLPGYGHSAFSIMLDGRTWVLAATVLSPSAQQWQFYEIITTPLGARLNHVFTYTAPPPDNAAGSLGQIGGHTDGWIQVHPLTGKTLAYLVGGPWFIILDITDPANPQRLDVWSDAVAGRESPVANLHSVYPLGTLIDGRHYTVIGPEFGAHPASLPSGVVWVMDTTDPQAVCEVAAWTLPHEVEWAGTYMFSNHYLTAWNTTVFVSMYHGGVWALDLTGIQPGGFVQLPSVGVFVPTDPVVESAIDFRWTPTLEEVISFDDGTLVTFDSMTGLWTFTFDATDPAPAPEPTAVEPITQT